ncbi:hypothetical protein [Alkalisalibacterium limincola]|uniref:hypothetical protein n=1 Tax=Alkalisalibacterium limincola TaxID=2699169 RepID=UPI0021079FAF|nr:hypothetical protein [Alkalisalibacterium limincola]
MSRQIDRDHVAAAQVRQQRHEAGGVVEPAVHRQYRRGTGVAVAQRGDDAPGGFQAKLAHQSSQSPA